MRKFNIYRHESGDYKVVKDGWSWPGFLFTCWWAFAKKLYGAAFIALGVSFATNFATHAMAISRASADQINLVAGLVGVIMAVVFGSSGNQWVANKLERLGYEKIDTVEAKNENEALAPYVNEGMSAEASVSEAD